MSLPLFAGKRVRMSGSRLRAQCVSSSSESQTVLVTCFKQNQLVGHAFATVWKTSIGKQRVDLSSISFSSELTS